MQVKRWLALLLAGVTAMSIGIAYLLIAAYKTVPVPADLQPFVSWFTLQHLSQSARAGIFLVIGLTMALGGLYGLNRSLLTAVAPNGAPDLVDIVDRRRRRRSDAKIVAIGGGTGLSTLLRGLKQYTDQITAIVTVADDGGSSGRLRQSLGVHPPGDFRQCIAALANTEPLMQRLFEYRFGDGTELGGHAFGNLFIVAMTSITGSFESALRASSRVLAVRGRIVPSTLTHVTLFAELADDRVLAGESKVPHGAAPIRRVFLEPDTPAAYPEAVAAILDADLIILGPGSLYTSVLPNVLVPDIGAALEATRAPVLFVANVATQPGETDGYSLQDHVDALTRHLGRSVIDIVVANDNLAPLHRDPQLPLVQPILNAAADGPTLQTADLISDALPTRHDPDRLAAAIARLLRDTGRRNVEMAVGERR